MHAQSNLACIHRCQWHSCHGAKDRKYSCVSFSLLLCWMRSDEWLCKQFPLSWFHDLFVCKIQNKLDKRIPASARDWLVQIFQDVCETKTSIMGYLLHKICTNKFLRHEGGLSFQISFHNHKWKHSFWGIVLHWKPHPVQWTVDFAKKRRL